MELIAERIKQRQATPAQVLVVGYAVVIAVGVLLLLLPFAAAPGRTISPVDALFMATSAVSVTGLVVKDLQTEFSLFGQVVIMLLVQIGGLGYMTSATVLALLLGKKIGLRERLVIQESMNALTLEGLIRITKTILGITLVVEGTGAALLAWDFSRTLPLPWAIYHGVFHAVAAFNNAGFSTFSRNLMDYRGDVVVNLVVTSLVIIGGLGFIVYSDLYKYLRGLVYRISVHTKLALTTSALLIVIPTALFLAFESGNNGTIGGLSFGEQLLAAYFQIVITRTAGFNTIDIGALGGVTLYMMILLMFVGGSPNGTSGGIKTTTFATMILALWATIRGRADVTAFHRRLTPETVARAFQLAMLAFLTTTGVTLAVLLVEKRVFLNTLFEVMSAFGTVGLSMGDGGVLSYSAIFSSAGKILICVMMFIGRVGPLTIGAALIQPRAHVRYRLPEGKCLIG